MNSFLTLAFLFFLGSVLGWVLELFFRRFLSRNNSERKWINPGFCIGPYLSLYGTGLCLLYLIASLEENQIIPDPFGNRVMLFLLMAFGMTIIEYLAGNLLLNFFHIRLWDYTNEWANIQGIICPKFSLIWAISGIIYYYLLHPHILTVLLWLSNHPAFSFFIGLFFGIWILDTIHSARSILRQQSSKGRSLTETNDTKIELSPPTSYQRWKG